MSKSPATSLRTPHNIRRVFDPFLVVCSPGEIAQAVHALYYLPENYSLVVMSDGVHASADTDWMDSLTFKHRIQFNDEETNQSTSSLFSSAGAVIANEQISPTSNAPRVIVSSQASGITPTDDGFTVQTDNPEALASALLSLARK